MDDTALFSQKHFLELSEKVQSVLRSKTWIELHGREWINFGLRAALFGVSFWIFSLPHIAAKAVGLVLLSYFYYGIGITGTHETGHFSMVESVRLNRIFAYFFSDFWASQSSLWWYHRHVEVHHAFTNVPTKEPRIFFYPWLNKYLFFFVVPFLVFFWLIINSIKFLWGKWDKLFLYLLVAAAGILFHVWLFTLVVPLGWALLGAFIMRSLFAPVFMHLATFNHIDLDTFATRPPWLPHQSKTTRNLRPSWFLNGMGGNAFVECHIEHHLFPRLSNRMLSHIRPIIHSYLEKEHYVYIEDSYGQCLKNCLKHYKTLFVDTALAI